MKRFSRASSRWGGEGGRPPSPFCFFFFAKSVTFRGVFLIDVICVQKVSQYHPLFTRSPSTSSIEQHSLTRWPLFAGGGKPAVDRLTLGHRWNSKLRTGSGTYCSLASWFHEKVEARSIISNVLSLSLNKIPTRCRVVNPVRSGIVHWAIGSHARGPCLLPSLLFTTILPPSCDHTDPAAQISIQATVCPTMHLTHQSCV